MDYFPEVTVKNFLAISFVLSFLVPVAVSASSAQPGAVLFDGDAYLMQLEKDKDYVRSAEFVRADESLDNWTRLIAVRHHPRLLNPLKAAEKFGKKLQEDNPGLIYQVSPCNGGEEAVIEFTLNPGGVNAIFNVYRFMRREGYAGLISYQFASRIPALSVEKVGLSPQERQKWVNELVRVNFDYRFGNPVQRTLVRQP